MRMHLVGPIVSPTLARRLQARGDTLSQGRPVPPDADVYVFGRGDEVIRSLTHGLVILDLRADPDLVSAAWSAYADLCVVGSAAARAALAEASGCEPERIFVAADQADILDLADRALRDELPPASVEKRGTPMTDQAPTPLDSTAALAGRLEALTCQAEIMDRGYEVRSRLPVVGPVVAWVRRNLTSHLREPYLDPTLERQIAFNRTAVAWMKDAQARLQAMEEQIRKLQDRREV
jgi:hypothetical protein